MGTNVACIEISQLSKTFGKVKAVDNLSLTVSPGEVLGFLGPNGAGKTTVMRMLTGLIRPSSGEAKLLGFNVSNRDPKMLARIGYLPGSLGLYENLTSNEFLRFVAKMRRQNLDVAFKALAERFQLDLHKHIHDLSKGNRQKVGVVAAFMHQPEVLILDEPTSGLDPLMQREFEGLLAEAKARGAATLLSSHVMSEVEHLSNRVAIIDRGKLLMLDEVAALKTKAIRRLEFTFGAQVDANTFRALEGVRDAVQTGNRIMLEVVGPATEVIRQAAALGATEVRSEDPSLDEIFVGLIGGTR